MNLLNLFNKLRTILVFLLTFSHFSTTFATDLDSEYLQKAKIIRFLAGELGWPSQVIQNNTIHICMLGEFDQLNILNTIQGKTVKNRKIVTRSISNLEEAKLCNIIYISKSEKDILPNIIKAFESKPVLLLGDMDKFAQNGGTMNFIILNKVVALTINYDSLKKSNLTFSLKNFDQITVIPEKEELMNHFK